MRIKYSLRIVLSIFLELGSIIMPVDNAKAWVLNSSYLNSPLAKLPMAVVAEALQDCRPRFGCQTRRSFPSSDRVC